MILHHVADGADLLIKGAPALDAEILCHSDLHALDVRTIPKRFEHGVGEAKEEHAMDGLFPQVVVNAKNPLLVKGLQQDLIQGTRRGQVTTKRLFYYNPSGAGASGARELLHDLAECVGRDSEVIRGYLCRPDFTAKSLKHFRFVVIAADKPQQTAELIKGVGVQTSVILQAFLGPGFESVQRPPFPGNTDYGYV